MRAILVGAILLACLGCAEPRLTTKPVRQEPTIIVGLATYDDGGKAAHVRHEHPAEWAAGDLHAVLTRLLLQERGGLMDTPRPPRAVFSQDEVRRLLPGLREAFRIARPSDWVVFALLDSAGATPEWTVTSGALFLEDRRLHVVLANHREPVPSGADGPDAIRADPFRSLRGVKGGLTFDSSPYVVASHPKWLGNFSGSELVLDHSGFLEIARQAIATPTETLAMEKSPPPGLKPEATHDSETAVLKEEVSRLREELARLKRRLAEQTDELARLKAR